MVTDEETGQIRQVRGRSGRGGGGGGAGCVGCVSRDTGSGHRRAPLSDRRGVQGRECPFKMWCPPRLIPLQCLIKRGCHFYLNLT